MAQAREGAKAKIGDCGLIDGNIGLFQAGHCVNI
jgi:hypothetical protein